VDGSRAEQRFSAALKLPKLRALAPEVPRMGWTSAGTAFQLVRIRARL